MGQISSDCPHRGCRTKNVAVSLFTVAQHPGRQAQGVVFGACSVCHKGLCFDVVNRNGGTVSDAYNYGGEQFSDRFKITDTYPAPRSLEKIRGLPKNVESAFLEAEQAYQSGLNSAAAGMYRKVIERTLKQQRPDDTGMLHARIRKIEKENAIPQHLIDLLDTIKFLGNEAMHEEEDDPNPDDVTAGREFTKLFLTYTYELPTKVEAALEKYRPKSES